MLKKLFSLIALMAATSAFAAIDVNKASEADLDGLKGIGPSTTQLILSERKKAEFKDWSDLMKRVKGIGPSKAAKLSAEGLTVRGAAYAPAPAAEGKGGTGGGVDGTAVTTKGQPTSSTAVKPAEIKETKGAAEHKN